MRANLLKCDEGRLNSIIMFEKCSKYFRIKLHLFVWQIWERKDNKTCGYKDQSPSEYFGIKLHLLSLTHVGKKRQYNLLIKNFEWLDIFTTVKNVNNWKLVLWLDWVIGFELWQNLRFQTHYLWIEIMKWLIWFIERTITIQYVCWKI